MTFVRNHAQAMLTSNFFVVVTARFRVLYVFVIMEVGTRKIAYFNVTDDPTAAWTRTARISDSGRGRRTAEFGR
jgi:hypothetical protein